MNDEQWFNDGHRITAVLRYETVDAVGWCPYEDGGKPHPKVKRATCGETPGECWIKTWIDEAGWEANDTGLPVSVGRDVPIDVRWGFDDEFFFKVAGYPSGRDVKSARQEISEKYDIKSVYSIPWEAVDVVVLATSLSEDERDEELRTILERHGLIGEPTPS